MGWGYMGDSMVDQTRATTQTGKTEVMNKHPRSIAVFRHTLRLFPIVFRDVVKDDHYSVMLHICRSIISASTILNTPSSKSIDHDKIVRLEDVLKRVTLASTPRGMTGISLVQEKSEFQTQITEVWGNGLTMRRITAPEYNALRSATRALALSIGYSLDCDNIRLPQTDAGNTDILRAVEQDLSTNQNQLLYQLEQTDVNYAHILRELERDLSANQRELLTQPLWTSDYENEKYARILYSLSPDSASPEKECMWSFWQEWYAAFLVGEPVDWTLQSQIAFISDDIWESGVDKLSKEIEHIKAKLLSEKLPLAETIDLNSETNQFFVSPVPVNNAPLLSALLTNISDTMEDALQGNNGFSGRSSEHRKISRVVTRYGNNPQQAEVTLTTVARGLRRQLFETNDLPKSEDNLALLEAVEDGVRGIRANHPEVAINREQLARQAFKELGEDDRRLLERARPVLNSLSEGDLARDFAEDIPSLINDSLLPVPEISPSLPGADAATRLFSRASNMALLLEKASEWHDSKTAMVVRLGMQGVSVSGFLYRLVQLGLKLLGVL